VFRLPVAIKAKEVIEMMLSTQYFGTSDNLDDRFLAFIMSQRLVRFFLQNYVKETSKAKTVQEVDQLLD
jgi:valyl-tRNA synthetase